MAIFNSFLYVYQWVYLFVLELLLFEILESYRKVPRHERFSSSKNRDKAKHCQRVITCRFSINTRTIRCTQPSNTPETLRVHMLKKSCRLKKNDKKSKSSKPSLRIDIDVGFSSFSIGFLQEFPSHIPSWCCSLYRRLPDIFGS